MQDEASLIQLAGEIYDAAIDPVRWPNAIERAVRFVGGAAGWLIARDSIRGTSQVFYGFAEQPGYRQAYLDTYIQIEPVSHAISSLQPGEAISNSGVTSRDEFLKTRFYKEWMEPQGWLDNASVVLDRRPTKISAFAIVRSKQDGWVDESVLWRMRLIAPHLRRSFLAGEIIHEKATEAAALAETLDGIDAAVFFVDTEGNIVDKNANGAAMLAESLLSGAMIAQQTLPEYVVGATLLDAFVRARQNGASNSRDFCAPLKMRNGDQYVLHAMPLAPGHQWETSANHRAVAVLFVQKATIGSAEAAEAIARQYKLTRMELRVLLTLVQGGGAPETARSLGIAVSTVRTHLRRLFSKTGTSRQLDLAKLVAGFSSGISH
jgi:DNA-binding CsgD family transcriptional regulator